MGAGRCASTSCMNYLNTHEDFDIYGENDMFIFNILLSILGIDRTILAQKNVQNNISYNSSSYNTYKGTEWRNNIDKLYVVKNNLIKSIRHYLPNKKYIGFKEIRWQYPVSSINHCFNILEKIFDKVIYIHLIRNIEDQIKSMNNAWITKSKEYRKKMCEEINHNISESIKHRNYITKNISTDTNFLEEIYQYIISSSQH